MKPVLLTNIETGEQRHFYNIPQVSKFLGVAYRSLVWRLDYYDSFEMCGWRCEVDTSKDRILHQGRKYNNIVRTDIDTGERRIFKTVQEAADQSYVKYSTVRMFINGKRKRSGCGYTFELLEQAE